MNSGDCELIARQASILWTLAPIPDGLAVWGGDAKSAQNKISEWLRKLGLEK
jgi:hypothetical protein